MELNTESLSALGGLLVGMGGWKFISAIINRKTDVRKEEAIADKIEQENLRKQIDWILEKYESVSRKLDNLYKEFRKLEEDRIRLINEKNNLVIALRIAEYERCKGKSYPSRKTVIEALGIDLENIDKEDKDGILEVRKIPDKE